MQKMHILVTALAHSSIFFYYGYTLLIFRPLLFAVVVSLLWAIVDKFIVGNSVLILIENFSLLSLSTFPQIARS